MEIKVTKWYAVKTRSRWEKKIASLLSEKGIINFCPLQKKISQWSDRKKMIFEPIFRGFIFIKIESERLWDVKKVNGVINYLYYLGKPAVVREDEINKIKKFLNEYEEVEILASSFNISDKVRITQGALMNQEGILMDINGNKAIVKIESLGMFLSARLNKNILENINKQS